MRWVFMSVSKSEKVRCRKTDVEKGQHLLSWNSHRVLWHEISRRFSRPQIDTDWSKISPDPSSEYPTHVDDPEEWSRIFSFVIVSMWLVRAPILSFWYSPKIGFLRPIETIVWTWLTRKTKNSGRILQNAFDRNCEERRKLSNHKTAPNRMCRVHLRTITHCMIA